MFLRTRPTAAQIDRFLAESRDLPLSYTPVGLAIHTPVGFSVDECSVSIGSGRTAFDAGWRALQRWRQFELGWTQLFPRGAVVQQGTTVAVVVRHLGFWSINGCRIVYTLDDNQDTERGFAYGTLTNHAESGEEVFAVTMDPRSGDVRYRIRAASRPRAFAARCGYPFTRLLQARFRRESMRAMAEAVSRP